MTVSGISGASAYNYPTSAAPSGFPQALGALESSLGSGDLSGAEQAYASLSALASSGPGPLANSNSPLAQALSAIGQALQSGNLTAAQQALTSFQQARGHHHHGHHDSTGGGTTSTAKTAHR
jgi:hypothetical protein